MEKENKNLENSVFKKTLLSKTFKICLFLFVLTLLIFTFRFRYGGTGDTIPNQLLPISIIYEHNLDLNEFVCQWDKSAQSFKYSSETCQKSYWWSPINGRAVSDYPIIPGLLNLPVYLIAFLLKIDLLKNMYLLSLITAAIISSLSVVFMFLLLEQVCKKRSLALYFSLIYAFCTLVWSLTSRNLWQHGPSLLLINISLFILYKKNPKLLPWAGLFLGFAIFNRPTNLFIVLPLTVYFLLNHKKYFWKYCLLGAIPAALLILYSCYYIGSINSLGQGNTLAMEGVFMEGFTGLLFSPARGLFVFSPIFILSLLYIPKIFSKKEEKITKYLLISLILLIFAYSKWGMWWGGYSFGYRLIAESIPFFIILLIKSWTEIISKNKILIAIFVMLIIISLYFNFLGAQVASCGFDNSMGADAKKLWQIRGSELMRCNTTLFHFIMDINKTSQFSEYFKNYSLQK